LSTRNVGVASYVIPGTVVTLHSDAVDNSPSTYFALRRPAVSKRSATVLRANFALDEAVGDE